MSQPQPPSDGEAAKVALKEYQESWDRTSLQKEVDETDFVNGFEAGCAHARTETARWKALAGELAEALEKSIEETEGTIRAHYWSMNKEYLAQQHIDNAYHLKKFKQALAKYRAACGEGE